MDWLEVVKWGAPVLISGVSVWVAIASFRRARRADERSERIERLDRVQFELRPIKAQPGTYRLFNVGDEAVTGVTAETASIMGVSIAGQSAAPKLNPTEYMIFSLVPSTKEIRVPVSIRVAWTGPFAGERWILLPEDPDAPWAGVIFSE